MTPVVVQTAVHDSSQDAEGEALQVGPHHIATVGDQVQQAPQHCRPHLGALLLPLHFHTQKSKSKRSNCFTTMPAPPTAAAAEMLVLVMLEKKMLPEKYFSVVLMFRHGMVICNSSLSCGA